jgi:site-specific DNA-methyltransferase (adenine-specific)
MNDLICIADNLEFMRSLESSSIDLIYCDILFGTGNTFKDYEDPKFNSSKDISDFYLPRYEEMKRLLKSTGLIYIHCDYNISHYTKLLLDDVFGINNFRNEIIWYYNSAPRKKKDFGKRHDTIFRYSKSDDYFFNAQSKYVRQEYSPTAPRGYAKEKYYNPNGKILDDVWKIPMIGQNDKTERVNYSTQKPVKLLFPIIDSSCPADGTVADFFLGSGTTAVASRLLKRQFIGCDINNQSIEITNERLQKTTA